MQGNCSAKCGEAKIDDHFIVDSILGLLLKVYMSNAHGIVLVSVAPEKHIAPLHPNPNARLPKYFAAEDELSEGIHMVLKSRRAFAA
jgi:hypothetical protein